MGNWLHLLLNWPSPYFLFHQEYLTFVVQSEMMPLWEADWDDEDVDLDFSEKLKAELERAQSKR